MAVLTPSVESWHPMPLLVSPSISGNVILAAVERQRAGQLDGLLETQHLRMRESLLEAGDPTEYVYFPISGIISILLVLENGMMIEFATVGREGMTGVPLFLGLEEANMALVSQVPGEALRMSRVNFLAEVARNAGFAAIVGRYSGVMLALVAQSAACNRAHHVDERCARWLLMTHDQAGADAFPITQEFLAQMLGVSRPSVALSAEALQADHLISYHRGQLTILDRAGLELAACECYAVIRKRFRDFDRSLRVD
jgi:CRP-like cAMP-binding protein